MVEALLDAPPEVQTELSFKEMISAAKDKEGLAALADKIGLSVDNRMSIENIKKGLLESYEEIAKESKKVTAESTEKLASEDDPPVRIRFMIMDIKNPEEAPVFEFNNDCGKSVPRGGVIPKWSLVHGEECTVPFSLYEFLQNLTIPRSKWVADAAAPEGRKCITFQQKRFNCELLMTKEQVLRLQKTA